jgi:hypothetical protein
MAAPGSWPSIRRHGLLSTSKLLDLHGLDDQERRRLEAELRPECVPIGSSRGHAVIRDQKPMNMNALRRCLRGGLEPADWFRILNERSFFWLTKARLLTLLEGRAYRNTPQVVLTVDTASLVTAHSERIQLSHINSGATLYDPQPRGPDLFKSIENYPYELRRRKRGRADAIAELVVVGGVCDVKDHTVCVHDYDRGTWTEVWRHRRSDSANPMDVPWP